jgi:hypothetical protein
MEAGMIFRSGAWGLSFVGILRNRLRGNVLLPIANVLLRTASQNGPK